MLQRLRIFLSRVGTSEKSMAEAEIVMNEAISASALAIDRVRKILDHGVCQELFGHLSQLGFDFIAGGAILFQRNAEQLSHPNIFHARESERSQRMFDCFALRVENPGLQLDCDGGFHFQFVRT